MALATATLHAQPAPLPGQGKANADAMIRVGNARITVLSRFLVRLEWNESGRFEDRPTLVFTNRAVEVPEFTQEVEGEWHVISTEDLTVRYSIHDGRFSAENLEIEYVVDGEPRVWHPGDPATENLLGTVRSLDGTDGDVPLDQGLLSRDGWALVDDSFTPVFAQLDPPRVEGRPKDGNLDWYFFGHGHDYKAALADYRKLAGPIPMPPRYVFGAWWSRYWPYTDAELRELVAGFEEHRIPLDVLVIDTDWHLPGWTGYTWDTDRFPDPKEFLGWTEKEGLRVALNIHPHEGVKKHEAGFENVAKALGVDPQKADEIPFQLLDPKYIAAAFKYLYRPLEEAGVDFFWLDWQQGKDSSVPRLDPQWWLDFQHWRDQVQARPKQRPLNFSRWGGLGDHRYPIGFSGDTYSTWEALSFQPYMTATASNVGFAYWSHDIGGYFPGAVNGELFTRWVQWGAMSPILRTHANLADDAERRPWAFKEPYPDALREAYRLRYALLPYVYTFAHEAYETGVGLLRPMYYEFPEYDSAYNFGGQYFFGDQMFVAPIDSPVRDVNGMAEKIVWVPDGIWTEWYTGEIFQGPRIFRVPAALDEIPIFVRDGGIVPLALGKPMRSEATKTAPLAIKIFPGDRGEFTLYEDDGLTNSYMNGEFTQLPIEHHFEADARHQISIGPMTGKFSGAVDKREIEIRLPGTFLPVVVLLDGSRIEYDGSIMAPVRTWYYDAEAIETVVRLGEIDLRKKTVVTVIPQSRRADGFVRGYRADIASYRRAEDVLAREAPESKSHQMVLQTLKDIRSIRALPDRMQPVLGPMEKMRVEMVQALVDDDDVSTPTRSRALAQLVALTGHLSIERSEEPEPKATARAEVILRTSPRLIGKITLQPPDHWQIEGVANRTLEGSETENRALAQWEIKADDPSRNGHLSADVEIRWHDIPLYFTLERTVPHAVFE